MTMPRTFLRVGLPFVVLVMGVAILVLLVRSRPEAQRTKREARAPLVTVRAVTSGSRQVTVEAQGTTIPAERIVLQPEVTGRIVWQSEELVPGGRFLEGETLLRIDPRDYRTTVEQQSAQLSRARLELEVERGRQVVAEREWELLDGDQEGSTEEGRALALREPQVETAKVAVRAARSGLRKAHLALNRTTIKAPFNAFVQTESADVGQLVGPQSPLATLVGSDRFWVQVSIPVQKLAWIDVPGVNAETGAPVRITQDLGGTRLERSGRVVRLLGDLDPVGRMARVLVEIDDPLDLDVEEGKPHDGVPLLLGAYVRVDIAGRTLDGVIEVPRTALREGDRVWVMSDANRLEIREADVVWRLGESVLVRAGLHAGERLVTSRIPTAVDGMELRVDALPPAAMGKRAGAR